MYKKITWLLAVALSTMLVFMPIAQAVEPEHPEVIISEVLDLIESIYWQDADRQALVEGAISGMLQALNDPWSEYLTEEEYRMFMEAVRSEEAGLGVRVVRESSEWVVKEVLANSPAESAGLLPGDILTAIDGQAVQELDGEVLMSLIAGEQNTWIVISVRRGEQDLHYRIMRGLISMPTVEQRLLGGGLGYLRITSFGDNTPQEVAAALGKLRSGGANGLVIDLRDNPGGIMESVIGTAQELLPAGPILQVHKRDGTKDIIETTGTTATMPMVALVNQFTASAAEVLAGAIRDQADGLLIGDTTYGKGVMQDIYELEGYGAMKITSAMFTTPAGAMINQIGLEPDLAIKPSAEGLPLLDTMRTLYPGISGDEVATLQQALAQLGLFHSEPSGLYDKQTEDAVRVVQSGWAEEDADGVADSWTQLQINEQLMQQAADANDQAILDAARAWLSSRMMERQVGMQRVMSWMR